MYRRYSQANGNAASPGQVKRSRIKDLLILVLAGLLTAALIIGIPAMQKGNGTRMSFIRQMQTECDEAARQTASLSRNAGADSASILARVRSNLHAIRIVNDLNAAQNGGSLVPEERILTLQNTVDRYLTYLTTGMDTGEYQTNLQNALEELQTELNELK